MTCLFVRQGLQFVVTRHRLHLVLLLFIILESCDAFLDDLIFIRLKIVFMTIDDSGWIVKSISLEMDIIEITVASLM